MRVTTLDFCHQGFERLRSEKEIILIDYPAPWDTGAEICERLQADLQQSAAPENLDFEAARAAIYEAFKGFWEDTEIFETEEEYEGPKDLDEGGPQLYCYLRIED